VQEGDHPGKGCFSLPRRSVTGKGVMKTTKWDEMPKKKGPIAVNPLNSNRGQSVMGHALETAIQWMGIDPVDIVGGTFEQFNPYTRTMV